MAPLIVNVKNSSSKPRDLYTKEGTVFHIPNGETKIINHYLHGTVDTKIQINSTDVRSYLLKYVKIDKVINIKINDTLGQTSKVEDTAIWAKYEEEDLYMEIFDETINISTTEKDLRVYQVNGTKLSDRYYQTVIGSNNATGGITITGVDEKGVQTKEGSSKDY